MLSSIERGVGAGAIGGIGYGLYVAAIAHPLASHAESAAQATARAGERTVEHGHEHAMGHGHEHAASVSELTTALVSVGSGVLWGVLLGAAFGLAYYVLEPALPGRGSTRAVVLAGAGFLTVSAVPWLVLPPAVPGVEQPVATDLRLAFYAATMALGAAVAAASVLAYRRARDRGHGPGAGALAGAVPLLAVGIAVPLATPSLVETGSAPTDLVLAVRGTVALSQAGLWACIAASYCWLGGWFPDADAELAPDAEEFQTGTS